MNLATPGGGPPELDDYPVLSVMYAYSDGRMEDGNGLHVADTYLVRRLYDPHYSIQDVTDFGVESYYASSTNLSNSTTKSSYYPGESITLSNVTVENMSYYDVIDDLRVRFFLSTNRTITTSDIQMGSYWYWTSFPTESSHVDTYTTTIPRDTPAGTYYVGAIVTHKEW